MVKDFAAWDIYNKVNELMRDGKHVAAARLYADFVGVRAGISNTEQAKQLLNGAWRSLLDSEDYLSAAVMNWGYSKFDARPELVQTVFNFLPIAPKLAFMGAMSCGKTYSIVAWLYLEYQRDPMYTNIKVTAINEAQINRNIFTHLFELHRESVMNVVGFEGTMSLCQDSKNKDSGFEGILVPQDSFASGRLRGIKPKPRAKAHPRFGKTTRVRLFVDEIQNCGRGMIDDFGSILSSINGPDRVKVIVSGNPDGEATHFKSITEPRKGWGQFDPESDHQWISKQEYYVCRLDGLKSENVQQKEEVYPGILTWDGFRSHLLKGTNSADYWTKARGCFPPSGSINAIVSEQLMDRSVGEALWHRGFTPCASIDVALVNDSVVFTAGRWGMATGVKRGDETTMFTRGDGQPGERFVLQIDQQIEIADFDEDTVTLAKRIIELAEDLNINPRNLGLDATGLGEGVYSYLSNYWGPVLPVRWGEKATDMKIMYEDKDGAVERYSRVCDEVWFATSRWMQAGAIIISPSVSREPLWMQVTSRRVGQGRGSKMTAQTKNEWKAANFGISPDYADSFVQLVQVARARSGVLPSLDGTAKRKFSDAAIRLPDVSEIKALDFDAKTAQGIRRKPIGLL